MILEARLSVKKYVFVVIDAAGEQTAVIAKSRAEAITTYLKRTGMSRDFFDRLCKIKKQGAMGG